jgi:hypothetical protein
MNFVDSNNESCDFSISASSGQKLARLFTAGLDLVDLYLEYINSRFLSLFLSLSPSPSVHPFSKCLVIIIMPPPSPWQSAKQLKVC